MHQASHLIRYSLGVVVGVHLYLYLCLRVFDGQVHQVVPLYDQLMEAVVESPLL